jgi:hypothetical protein
MDLSIICITAFLVMVGITVLFFFVCCLWEREWTGAWFTLALSLLLTGVALKAMGM